MSKYHRIRMALAEDWTTTAGIAEALRGRLNLRGYRTDFEVLRDGEPIDRETARLAIIGWPLSLIDSPVVLKRQHMSWQYGVSESINPRSSGSVIPVI